MKFLIFALLLAGIFAEEMIVTKDYTDFLKKHVSWEVAEYEENVFRGWTLEEAKMLLGAIMPEEMTFIPSVKVEANLPSSLDWSHANCDHGVRSQGNCGSNWAITVTGMLSDRCCLQGHDNGWLAPQELISCDKHSQGCNGGYATWALDYVISVKGMVPEACSPYLARNAPCPTKCADGKDWKAAHVCDCKGGYKACKTVDELKTCLKSGPVSASFKVCKSFYNYKSGVYKCDCSGSYTGLHASLAMGYSDTPEPNFYMRNSWGPAWGNKGYFNIGVNECEISGPKSSGNVMCEKVE